MSTEDVAAWLAEHPLTHENIDCVTAVMLKALDGKCKMTGTDKQFIAELYELIKRDPGVHLGSEIHRSRSGP